MQIEQLVLYGTNGQQRVVQFNLNGVSILTGDSATGKSAIIEIIDYCLGARECRVPDGIIRETVAWFGLQLVVESGQVFVARKAPEGDHKSSGEFMIIHGRRVPVPVASELVKTQHNREDGVAELSRHLGMSTNRIETEEYETRPEYDVTIRHAIKFCMQYQDEIASKRSLFHQQAEGFRARSIYDSLPYLLGLRADDYLAKQERLREARRQLARARRRLQEYEHLASGGWDLGYALVREASDVRILSGNVPSPATSVPKELEAQLQLISDWSPTNETPEGGDELTSLQTQLISLELERSEKKDQLRFVQDAESRFDRSTTEVSEQHARLESVEIFRHEPSTVCPLCEQSVPGTDTVPTVDAVRAEFAEISRQLDSVNVRRPQLTEFIGTIRSELEKIDTNISAVRAAIRKLRQNSKERSANFDLSVRQAITVGRVKQYLSGMRAQLSEGDALRNAVRTSQDAVDDLDSDVGRDVIRERIRAVSNQLQRPMSHWAESLGLEFSGDPFRINFEDLSVEVSRQSGILPLYRMGSGKNWLGCHLLAHFALHQYFVENRRPVPRFLVLDQLTQVFFPPEDVDANAGEAPPSVKSEDRAIVARIFAWIFKQTAAINNVGPFQVIVLDHAEIATADFQAARIEPERWRPDGVCLIPNDWRQADDTP